MNTVDEILDYAIDRNSRLPISTRALPRALKKPV
jgi:hypothetical protein